MHCSGIDRQQSSYRNHTISMKSLLPTRGIRIQFSTDEEDSKHVFDKVEVDTNFVFHEDPQCSETPMEEYHEDDIDRIYGDQYDDDIYTMIRMVEEDDDNYSSAAILHQLGCG